MKKCHQGIVWRGACGEILTIEHQLFSRVWPTTPSTTNALVSLHRGTRYQPRHDIQGVPSAAGAGELGSASQHCRERQSPAPGPARRRGTIDPPLPTDHSGGPRHLRSAQGGRKGKHGEYKCTRLPLPAYRFLPRKMVQLNILTCDNVAFIASYTLDSVNRSLTLVQQNPLGQITV